MRHAQFLIGLGVLALSAMPALAKPAYVASTVNLRAAPGTGSEILAKIPGGSTIDAKDCSEGWCAVAWRDKSGYAIQSALDLSGRPPRQAVRRPAYPGGPRYADDGYVAGGYVDEDAPVYYAPPPRYYYGGYYGPYYGPSYGAYYRPYWGWRRRWW